MYVADAGTPYDELWDQTLMAELPAVRPDTTRRVDAASHASDLDEEVLAAQFNISETRRKLRNAHGATAYPAIW